jgi:Gly-Xaa carboxypeptidase
VKDRDSNLLNSLAEKFNLTYEAFGKKLTQEGAASSGTLTLSDAFHDALEPAPVTPTGKDAAPYQLLSGTIKATYNSHRSLQGADTIVVAPGMPSGNTGVLCPVTMQTHVAEP